MLPLLELLTLTKGGYLLVLVSDAGVVLLEPVLAEPLVLDAGDVLPDPEVEGPLLLLPGAGFVLLEPGLVEPLLLATGIVVLEPVEDPLLLAPELLGADPPQPDNASIIKPTKAVVIIFIVNSWWFSKTHQETILKIGAELYVKIRILGGL